MKKTEAELLRRVQQMLRGRGREGEGARHLFVAQGWLYTC